MQTVSRPDLIQRRAMLAGALSCLGMAALAPPARCAVQPRILSFEVLRNGRKIGEQAMSFAGDDDLTVHTQTDMTVTLGPISLFRYRHEATERWQGGRFTSLQTRTDSNGKILQVSARREGGAVHIQPAAGAAIEAADATLPFTHWNRKIAAAPLFNPQDGKLLKERGAPAGAGAVTLADGGLRQAEGVVFKGEASIEDWYDEDAVWTALTGRLKDGSAIDYRRL
jgi:hypothetical protein